MARKKNNPPPSKVNEIVINNNNNINNTVLYNNILVVVIGDEEDIEFSVPEMSLELPIEEMKNVYILKDSKLWEKIPRKMTIDQLVNKQVDFLSNFHAKMFEPVVTSMRQFEKCARVQSLP